MDAERALGNGFVLPAGPLRELPSRLKNVDFVIIDRPGSFISVGHFTEGAGLDLDEYQVVVVKQGYLFAELRKLAKLAILALTPGATHQIIENMEYHKIIPPVYPLHITPEVAG